MSADSPEATFVASDSLPKAARRGLGMFLRCKKVENMRFKTVIIRNITARKAIHFEQHSICFKRAMFSSTSFAKILIAWIAVGLLQVKSNHREMMNPNTKNEGKNNECKLFIVLICHKTSAPNTNMSFEIILVSQSMGL